MERFRFHSGDKAGKKGWEFDYGGDIGSSLLTELTNGVLRPDGFERDIPVIGHIRRGEVYFVIFKPASKAEIRGVRLSIGNYESRQFDPFSVATEYLEALIPAVSADAEIRYSRIASEPGYLNLAQELFLDLPEERRRNNYLSAYPHRAVKRFFPETFFELRPLRSSSVGNVLKPDQVVGRDQGESELKRARTEQESIESGISTAKNRAAIVSENVRVLEERLERSVASERKAQAKVSELKSAIELREENINSLKTNLLQTDNDKKRLQRVAAQRQLELEALDTKLKVSDNQVQELTIGLSERGDEIINLQASLTRAKKKSEEYISRLNVRSARLDQTRSELSASQSELQEAERSIARLSKKSEELSEQVTVLKEDLERPFKQESKAKAEIQRLNQLLSTLSERVSGLESNLLQTEKDKEELQQVVVQKSQEIEVLGGKLGFSDDRVRELTEDLASRDQEICDLETSLSSSEVQIEERTGRLTAQQAELDHLKESEAMAAEAQEKFSSHGTEIRKIKFFLRCLTVTAVVLFFIFLAIALLFILERSKGLSQDVTIKGLEQDVSDRDGEITALNAKNESYGESNRKLTNDVKSLMSHIDSLERDATGRKEKITALNAENESYGESNRKLTNDVKSLMSHIDSLERDATGGKEKITSLQDQLTETNGKIERLKQENEQLPERVTELVYTNVFRNLNKLEQQLNSIDSVGSCVDSQAEGRFAFNPSDCGNIKMTLDDIRSIETNLGSVIDEYINLTKLQLQFFGKLEKLEGVSEVKIAGDLQGIRVLGLFKTNSHELSNSGKAVLREIGEALKKLSSSSETINWILRVDGHADADGEPSDNWELSKKRSTEVVEYLVDVSELDKKMFEAEWFGDKEPIKPNAQSSMEKAENRRIELKLRERSSNH